MFLEVVPVIVTSMLTEQMRKTNREYERRIASYDGIVLSQKRNWREFVVISGKVYGLSENKALAGACT